MRRTRHSGDSRFFFDWLEIAARDLLAAKLLIQDGQCLEIAGFHCQQCLEKAFKAYLIRQTGQLVDGHNLSWLCRQAQKQDPAFHRWMNKTAGLNRLYIETRYPSDSDLELTPQQAGEIYGLAEDCYTYICDQVYDGANPED